MISDVVENSFVRRPFKFTNATIDLEEFKPLVEEYSQATSPVFLSTSSLFCLSKN